jgi:hypothetical protein
MKRLPLVYHCAIGALFAGWVVVQSLPTPWFAPALLLFMVLTWLMYRWQLRATSRWINGFRAGRTLWVASAMLIVVVGLSLTSNPAKLPDRTIFSPWEGGLIAFFALTFLDWLWVKVYDAEIRSGK